MNLVTFFSHPKFERKYELMNESKAKAEKVVLAELYTQFGSVSDIINALLENYEVLPYHNLDHALLVASNCISLYKEVSPNQNDQELRSLIMAALFHDAGHSGGKTSDRENIKRACRILTTFSDTHRHIPFDVAESCRIISVTEFHKGSFPIKPTNYLQDILRDSDLLSSFDSSNFPQQLLGLKAELGLECSDLDMVKNNIAFLSSCLYYTEEANLRAQEFLAKLRSVLSEICK